MAKRRLFRKSKNENTSPYQESCVTDTQSPGETKQYTEQGSPQDYHETLYSIEAPIKSEKKQFNQTRWENSETIEQHVDDIRIQNKTGHHQGCSEVEATVDRILSKKKKQG